MIRHVRRGVRKIWATLTLLSLEVFGILVAFFSALALFVFVARMVFISRKAELDTSIFNFFANKVSNVNTDVMQSFSFLGAHYFLIPANIVLVLYFLFVRKERWYSIKVPAISLTSLLLMLVLKQFFHRERPLVPLLEAAKGMSFPSGHSLMSATFYGLLIYLVWRNVENAAAKWMLSVLLVLLIFFIGLSRIYLRVHYPTDVIAGLSLGFVWLVLSISILNKMERIGKTEVDLVVEK